MDITIAVRNPQNPPAGVARFHSIPSRIVPNSGTPISVTALANQPRVGFSVSSRRSQLMLTEAVQKEISMRTPYRIVGNPDQAKTILSGTITVDDITVLPRIPVPDPLAARQRPVRTVTVAPKGVEGEGFPVRRAFWGVDLADIDPFVHMDQMGEVDYAPGEPKGTPWHPHRGIETITYVLAGTVEHQDSMGNRGVIGPGDVQWMTAGSGIIHQEMPLRAEGRSLGFQLWVNLPRAQKMTPPRYQDLRASGVALLSSDDGGALQALQRIGGPDEDTGVLGEHGAHSGGRRRSSDPCSYRIARAGQHSSGHRGIAVSNAG